jgi:hypothetical protein
MPQIRFDYDFAMLLELAGDDLTKIEELKNISNRRLIETFYLKQVKKLNERIDSVAYMRSLEG